MSGFQAIILSIISIVLGFCFVFLTERFPKLGNDVSLTKLISLIYISPLFIAICLGIPVTLSIKMEISNFSFFIIVIIFGLITSTFAYYFIHDKPVLFNLSERKLTFSFFLFILFLFFSFSFLILSNTLLLEYGKYTNNIYNPKIIRGIFSGFLMVFTYSRGIFSIVCLYLFQTLLTIFRVFLSCK